MEIRLLRNFVGIVEAGSLTKAAEHLHVAQPALGMQIRALEREFGTKLLVRHSRGVTPTEAGAVFLGRARSLLDQVKEVHQEMDAFTEEIERRVAVGLINSIAVSLCAPLFEACRNISGKISLALADGTGEELLGKVVDEELDLAVIDREVKIADLACEPLEGEPLYLVTGCHPSRQETVDVDLDEALDRDLILPDLSTGARQLIDSAAKTQKCSVRILYEANTASAIRELVLGGIGPAILPFSAIRSDARAGSVVARRIVSPEIKHPYYLIVRKDCIGLRAVFAVCEETRWLVKTTLSVDAFA